MGKRGPRVRDNTRMSKGHTGKQWLQFKKQKIEISVTCVSGSWRMQPWAWATMELKSEAKQMVDD